MKAGIKIYFIPYILLEVPSNIIIRKVRPSWYLGGLMFGWGIVNMSMGFVQTYAQLVGLRVLLGIAEAGVLPGIIFLTSMYYKRHEYQRRISFLFSSTLVGGAFGGLLAYGIGNLGGDHGLAAWRWIFIIEGAVTSFIAIFAVFLIVDWPEQCRFLSEQERELVLARTRADGGDLYRMDNLNAYALRRIFTDYKIWLGWVVHVPP
jgi:MFS family permease